MKNIAILLPSLGMGGAERVASELANEINRRGISVHFLLLDHNTRYYHLDNNINVAFINYNKHQNVLFRNMERVKKIKKVLIDNSIDTVISFISSANFLAILATRNTKIKVYVSERSDPNVVSTKIKIIENLLYKKANGCIFQTEEAKRSFKKKIQNKSIVIQNPVRSNLPKWNDIKEHDQSIVTACRLEESKNIPMLIDAFAKVKKEYNNYKLIIYGKGSEENNIKKYINNMNLSKSIFLKGQNPNWHNEAINSTLFVLPSNYEGMSNSLIEALAMGMPVISTDHPIGGARALIKNNVNGVLVPINNSDKMKEEIVNIIKNKKKQNELSKEAIKINDTLNVKKITNEWIDYIQ